MSDGFWRRRLATPVLNLLRQGITPEKIALSIALGAALGVFPVLGSTTLLCAGAAVALRLNLPAMQVVNYLIYPLQLALLVPFMRLGSWMLGGEPVRLSASAIIELVQRDLWQAIAGLWAVTIEAVVAWFVVVPVPLALAYLVLRFTLRKTGVARSHPARDFVQEEG